MTGQRLRRYSLQVEFLDVSNVNACMLSRVLVDSMLARARTFERAIHGDVRFSCYVVLHVFSLYLEPPSMGSDARVPKAFEDELTFHYLVNLIDQFLGWLAMVGLFHASEVEPCVFCTKVVV